MKFERAMERRAVSGESYSVHGDVIMPQAQAQCALFIEHHHPRAGGMTALKGMAESESEYGS